MKLLGSVVIVLAGVGAQAVCAQSLFNEATVKVHFKGPVTGGTDAFDSNAGEHFSANAAANALAAYGVLKVGGTAQANFLLADGTDVYFNSVQSEAKSKARFTDYLTFSGQPALTQGMLAFDVLLRGEQSTAGAGPWGIAISAWQFDLLVNGQLFQVYRSKTLAVNPRDGLTFKVVDSGAAFSLHHYEIPIAFDSPVTIDATLEAGAFPSVVVAGADSSFEAGYDLARSAYWGGITSVTVGGNAVDFGVTSASGVDYRHSMVPVPEPGSAALLVLGLLALRAGRRASSRADAVSRHSGPRHV